jgi:hypothetical protein
MIFKFANALGGWEKKIKNWLNLKNYKKIIKKTESLKKLNKLIKNLKNWPVRFRFYKSETEKTKLNSNQKKWVKLEKTKPNQFEPFFVIKNRTETGRFEPVSVWFFYLKIRFSYFFIKIKPNRKWSPLILYWAYTHREKVKQGNKML